MMESQQDIITVDCPCGDRHQFAREFAGRTARCPKLNRRFCVPNGSGSVAFIVDSHPASPNYENELDTQPPPNPKGGSLVKRVTDLYHDHKQKRELYRQTHCRCPHCNAENRTADFMCAKCGCPLHDQQAAFLFMEKRRQEAHELKIAEAQRARELAAPPPMARQVDPPVYAPPRIQQKVIVRQGSGCLSIIGGIVVIILILVMIPICSAPLLVPSISNTRADRASREKPKPNPENAMGETLSVGYTSYCVWRAWFSDRLSSNQFLNKRANAKWLFLDVSVRNSDTKARMVPPFKLVDENGSEYESASEGTMIENAFGVLETLNSSVTKQGLIVFDVPQNHQYRLKVSGGYWSTEDGFIRIVPGSPP